MSENENSMPEENPSPPAEESISADESASEVDELKRERDEYLYLLKAKQAEFENYQKRAAKTREEELRYAALPVARDLLPALDNLERALDAAAQTGEGTALAEGVRAIHSQLLDTLRRHGVSVIEALGRRFDPNFHEAVSQQPSDEVEPQTVLQVYQQGYLMHDRVLRPAMVVVSVAGS